MRLNIPQSLENKGKLRQLVGKLEFVGFFITQNPYIAILDYAESIHCLCFFAICGWEWEAAFWYGWQQIQEVERKPLEHGTYFPIRLEI